MNNDESDNDLFEVRQSSIHNKGVFATKFIAKGTLVTYYKGELISKEESDKRLNEAFAKNAINPNHAYTYIFELDETYDLDGDIPENDAKYINHSCDPNLECDIKGHEVMLYSLRDINVGEELTYNYGFSFDEDTFKCDCKCGTRRCIGYICHEDEWPMLQQEIMNRNKLNS